MTRTVGSRDSDGRGLIACCRRAARRACAPKVKYVAPTVDVAAGASRRTPTGKPAQPGDAMLRGDWWELFGDPELNALEQQIDVSNQTLKAAEAQFAQARALVRGTRVAACSRQVDVAPVDRRVAAIGQPRDLDVSRRVRRLPAARSTCRTKPTSGDASTAPSARAAPAAQASAADLETARLSLHAELAVDYFTLRGIDRERQLLDCGGRVVRAGARADAEPVPGRHRVAGRRRAGRDRSSRRRARRRWTWRSARAALEHAIAVLVGRPASDVLDRRRRRSTRRRRPCRPACRRSCSNGVPTSPPPSAASRPPTRRSASPRLRSTRIITLVGRGRIRKQLARQPADRREQLLDDRRRPRSINVFDAGTPARGRRSGARRLRSGDGASIAQSVLVGVPRGRGSARRAADSRRGSGDPAARGRRRRALADAGDQPLSRRPRQLSRGDRPRRTPRSPTSAPPSTS